MIGIIAVMHNAVSTAATPKFLLREWTRFRLIFMERILRINDGCQTEIQRDLRNVCQFWIGRADLIGGGTLFVFAHVLESLIPL